MATEIKGPPGLLAAPFSRLKSRLRSRALLRLLAAGMALTATLSLLGLQARVIALAAVLLSLLLPALFALGRKARRPDAAAFARHLDRCFPQLEESSALLLADFGSLSPLQRMQRQRTEQAAGSCLALQDQWLPPLRSRLPLLSIVLCALLTVFATQLRGVVAGPGLPFPAQRPTDGEETSFISRAQVLITPPAYTGLQAAKTDQLDLSLVEGSTVEWRLQIEGPENEYELVFSGDEATDLTASGQGEFAGATTIRQTSLYRVVGKNPDAEQTLGGIHTLTVQRDRAPEVRIEAPAKTTLEIPMTAPPVFESEVTVSDDFGIGQVDILASVAKGSGEGVKFRDEVFAFDSSMIEDDINIYRRVWNLADLGMEPGDELYFFVTARDNRWPENNLGRSETVIVRWLDDGDVSVAAEGLAIDLMPEYFKSQRQIIIETEQLISDRLTLDPVVFDDASRSLGQSQRELKQRYGQYLGDEFDESEAPESLPVEETADAHGEHEGHAAGEPETGGSAEDLIARFGHDHGAAEIGPITAQSPVGMMKRSISGMWQAELHLLLSEPEKALPFEYEALEYLNLARAADRIYTRRLGFEPPPVTEDRRLSGEQDEILEYQRVENGQPDTSDARLFGRLFGLLAERPGNAPFSDAETSLLRAASDRLTTLAQQRPALIIHAATLESVLAEGRLDLPDCAGCLSSLRETAWSLTPPAQAGAQSGGRVAEPDDGLARDYLEATSQSNSP